MATARQVMKTIVSTLEKTGAVIAETARDVMEGKPVARSTGAPAKAAPKRKAAKKQKPVARAKSKPKAAARKTGRRKSRK
jgi:hypothetical protein